MSIDKIIQGKCVKWQAGRGYGFISPNDGGSNLFVHQSDIKADGFRSLKEVLKIYFYICIYRYLYIFFIY